MTLGAVSWDAVTLAGAFVGGALVGAVTCLRLAKAIMTWLRDK